jgi:hypothetical protein
MLRIFSQILDRRFLKNPRFVIFHFPLVCELITTVRNHCSVQMAGLICYQNILRLWAKVDFIQLKFNSF